MAEIAHVIINQRSGAGDKSTLHTEIETAFKARGWQVEFISVSGDVSRRVEAALARAGGTIVVTGGDGTINAVASAASATRRSFGIIPSGTFNYLSRNLGLPIDDVDAAVAVIADGAPRAVDAGVINGRLFLNNAGFGLYSELIERREQDKQRLGRNRLVALYSGLKCMLGSHPLYDVVLSADGEAEHLFTTTLFFGCNALQLSNYTAAAADCLPAGKLAVLSLKLRSRADIARAAWSGLTGRLEAADNIDAFCARQVRVMTRRRLLRIAIDGEIVTMRPPLEVSLQPAALQIYAPPPGAAAPA